MTEQYRANVLAEVLRQAALVPGPATGGAIFNSTLSALGLPEEEAAPEIYGAIALLVRHGLLDCNTASGERRQVRISHDTDLTPGPALVAFMWQEAEA